MSEPETIVAEVIDISTWEARLKELANEADVDAPAIRMPKSLQRRVNRQEIEQAFVTAFEMIGGVPRLALWADSHDTEFYRIFGRLLPKESITVHDGKVDLVHRIPPSKLDDQE